MSFPLVTVLMPVYNGEIYLREAIDSILTQTYKDFEFLIINDGSTDNSENIIASYNDSRIRYVKNECNLKLITTLNKGIELAKGKYIVRMDADDISAPTRIEKQVIFMEKNPEIGLCGSWFTSFGEVAESICKYKEQHDEILFKMFYQCHFCHPSLIIRKKVFEDLEIPFDKKFIHAEDYELYFRLATKWKFHNLQESLVKYRIHNSSVSRQNQMIQLEHSLHIRRMFFSFLGTDNSQEELKSFEALNHQDYKAVSISSGNIRIFLESMLIGNKKKHRLDKIFFDKQVKLLWFNYCYHVSKLKTFRKSKYLYNRDLEKSISRVKWIFRGIINKTS
jgi:glycosyltransferase involved in cell wall biosynthesis